MPSDVAILVVEDHKSWQEALPEFLYELGPHVRVDVAATYADALDRIRNHGYELVTIDLALNSDDADSYEGMQLLQELRDSRYTQLRGCGLIVLTAYPTSEHAQEAFVKFAVDNFLDKMKFDSTAFVQIVRNTLRAVHLRRAAMRARECYRLTIHCDKRRFTSSELEGPDKRASSIVESQRPLNMSGFTSRADQLNLLTLNAPPAEWRAEANRLGGELYQALVATQRLQAELVAAQQLGRQQNELRLQFSGPGDTLGLPFELLRDADEYLVLRHAISRRFVQPGPAFSRKPEPFYAFVDELTHRQERLRVLIVGANSDGTIPEAEAEAEAIASSIDADLDALGIKHDVRTLIGDQASGERVARELGKERYHIFHYAGHGRYNDTRPEVSGLVLRGSADPDLLTASQLNFLVRDTELRLVFLSCCLGARSAALPGGGEFRGVLEALARADVPNVVGYRWTVADDSARDLAQSFYQALWRSFSPTDALLEARIALARSEHGRNDPTWASPVLLAQNG